MSLSIPAHKEKYFLSKSKSHFFEALLILFFSAILSATAQQFTEAWTRKLPDAYGNLIVHGSHGDLIILGVGDIGSSVATMKIWKYDTLGTLLWTQTIIDTAGPFTTVPTGLVVDSLDNIYACAIAHAYGAPPNSPIKEGLLVKLNSAGNMLWYHYFGLNLNRWAEFYDLKLFKNKYIYLAGMSFDAVSAKSYLLVQYDSSGAFNWALPTAALCANQYTAVQLDKKGNAYALGYTNCHPPGWDAVLHKYDLQGNLLWSTLVNDTSTYFMNYGAGVIIDDSTNIYIAGKCANYNLPGISQVSLAKVDGNGSVKWFQSFYSSRPYAYSNDLRGFMLDSSNNIILSGKVSFQTPLVSEVFITKYDNMGNKKWANYLLNDSALSMEFVNGFITSQNQINLPGTAYGFNGNNNFSGPNIFVLDSNGVYLSNFVFNNGGTSYDIDVFANSIFVSGNQHKSTPNGSIDSLMICRIDFDLGTNIPKSNKNGAFNELKVTNPFHNRLVLSAKLPMANLEIVNMQGQRVWQGSFYQEIIIETNNWANGIYLVQVCTEEKMFTRKLVKY